MAYFSDYLDKIHYSPALPDWAQLGDRLFLADGVNPNIVLDGWPEHTRIMGVYPQQSAPALDLSTDGTPAALENGETYRYGVTRVMKIGSLVLESSLISDTITNDSGGTADGLVTLIAYEYPPQANSTWELYYRIYRSKKESTTMLYLVEEITKATYDGLTGGEYEDTTPDSGLDTSYSYNFDENDLNMFLPPVSCIRAWRGRLIAGGGYTYNLGSADISSGTKTVTLNSPGQVRETDRNASFWLNGEDRAFTISDVDESNNTLTLDRAADLDHTGADYAIWRDAEVLYAGEPLPGNIEGFDMAGSARIYTNLGAGGEIRGIAVSSNDFCYIFRSNSVEHVEGEAPHYQLMRKLQGVGCASHASIADKYSPSVFWYAGRAGVWRITGVQPEKISTAIDPVIENEVDHSMDHRTHGVYDPRTSRYYLWLFGSDWEDYTVRVPQLLLIYDVAKEEWYRCELAASCSGLQRRADNTLAPVIGLAGATAWLDEDVPYDGENITGSIESAAGDSITDTSKDFTSYTTLAGLPIHVEDGNGAVQRRIIKSVTGDTVTIYGTWDSTPSENDSYRIGSIRYYSETQELELTGNTASEKKVHRALAVVEPDTAENNVKMTLKGVREYGDRSVSISYDINGRGDIEMKGAAAGLRSRSCKVRFEGDSAREVKILTLAIETVDTNRT